MRYRFPYIPALIFLTVVLASCRTTQTALETADQVSLETGFKDPPRSARTAVYWLWLNGYVDRSYVEEELKAFFDAGIRGVCIFDMGARGDDQATPPPGPAFMSDQSLADVAHAIRVAQQLGMNVQLSVASSWDMGGTWVEPRHASMGLYRSELLVAGPSEFEGALPSPAVPAGAPRNSDGQPVFRQRVAVLAVPAGRRLPGHDFIFELDPPGLHTLDHCSLYNSGSNPADPGAGPHFTKGFSIAVSTSSARDEAFKEVLHSSLEATTAVQNFQLREVEARYVRLRLIDGHNPNSDRIQLAEFELYNKQGVNVVASHVADRSRDGAVLVGVVSSRGHDEDWTAGNVHDGSHEGPGGSWSSDGPPPVVVEKLDSVVDLTDRVSSDGRLKWSVPDGSWVIMVFECLNTGERLKVPSPKSDGLATDHLSREATRSFLDHLVGRLQSELGELGPTALGHLYLASYEVQGPIWTPGFPAVFRRYRGYDLTPYLPVLSGGILVDSEVTERFIYDYRKTLGELLVDAYYREAVKTAHAAGIGVESEAGGPGPPIHQVPVDALQALGAVDEVRGEFWPRRPDADRMWVVKETACAAHIYGKRRVHMEAFTSFHHWQDGPFDLKPSADRAFCEGANHFVWHTASHQPSESGKPGWVYLAGTHLNTNLIWWPKAGPFLDYLARCSFLLQQGLFVGDVCYYYGDQGSNFVLPKKVDPSLGFGYDYDVTNREVILNRMEVQEGRIVLPDGMSYELLVIPDRRDIDLEVLQRIEQLVRCGATVVGPRPEASTGLAGFPQQDLEVQAIAERLWGPRDGESVGEHRFGDGLVIWGRRLRDILEGRGLAPDFFYSSSDDGVDLDFIHRRTAGAEIYFIRNRKPTWERVEARFRVEGWSPELWEPDTGLVRTVYTFDVTDGSTSLPLQLAPFGSVFVVFRSPQSQLPTLTLEEPEPSPAALPATIDAWDGEKAVLTAFQTGVHSISTSDARQAAAEVTELPSPIVLEGDWALRFEGGPSAPVPLTFQELIPWTEHPDEQVRHFSGIGEYRKEFDLPAKWVGEGQRIFLDLGDLWTLAEVFLNGQSLGVLWKPPYRVEITRSAAAGRNLLVVQVANTWSNRLAGDSRLPLDQRSTRTNVTSSGGKPWSEVPLLRSGLFGPVRLLSARTVQVAVP